MYTRHVERRYSDDGIERWLTDKAWRDAQKEVLQRMANERGERVVALSPSDYELYVASPRIAQ